MHVDEVLKRFPLISDQIEPTELRVILSELQKVTRAEVLGEVVEFGCYAGTTSLFLQRFIQNKKQLHVYDSFEGLPEKTAMDQSPAGEQFKTGELAASKREFIQNFRKANLPLPHIHKGWFSELDDRDIPHQIAFGFLDGDYYDSIMAPLKLIWSHLSAGCVIIVDDYQNEALPGAQKAVDDWLKNHPAMLTVQSSLAILKP